MNRTVLAIGSLAGILLSSAYADAATCTPTGFFRDNIEMTAAIINPTAAVTGTVDATGCNIGVYADHGTLTVTAADVFGANYFGVLANADAASMTVHIDNNSIHNIGEFPLNGTQHGNAVYLRAFFAGNTMTGEVSGNFISGYQKGGIIANGQGVKVRIVANSVTGSGHVSFIAMNGIQIGYGAQPGEVSLNTVSGNSYDGHGDGSSSGGILVVGGPFFGTCPDNNPCPYTTNLLIGYSLTAANHIGTNRLFNNDVGILVDNADADGNAPVTPTSVIMFTNYDESDACFNPYQAGISDFGNTDYMVANFISSGGGHGTHCGFGIDTTGSVNPQLIANTVPAPPATLAAAAAVRGRVKVVPEKP